MRMLRPLRHFGIGTIALCLAIFSTAPAAAAATFVDDALRARIAQTTQSISSLAVDLDADGDQDLVWTRHSAAPMIWYRNTGGVLAPMPLAFPRKDIHDCTADDVNLDGHVDVYCVVGAASGTAVKANQLWIAQPDGTYVDRAATYGVTDPLGRGRTATFLDANHDAYPDLFVVNWYPRPDGRPTTNRLFLNVGGTSFRSAPEYGLDLQIGGIGIMPGCVQAADVNRDGWDDLLVCSMSHVRLFVRSGATYVDQSFSRGLTGFQVGGAIADVNRDGLLDVVLVNRGGVSVRLQQANGTFRTSYQRSVFEGRSVAVGDASGDGNLDVYVMAGGSRPGDVANPPDVLLLGNGLGSFVPVTIPQTSAGYGASVEPIDLDGDGATDFVVSNGANGWAGPVQLISKV